MYSYDDRVRAVELYVTLGKRTGATIGTRPEAELVNTMLDAAIETIPAESEGPVVHSGRGAHYRWPGWLSRIADAKLIRSMSRKGCSPDNAACKGFFGQLKTEMFYRRDWRATSIDQFTQALDSYIRWYNEKRIKIFLGGLSPVEYRTSLLIATQPDPRNPPHPQQAGSASPDNSSVGRPLVRR